MNTYGAPTIKHNKPSDPRYYTDTLIALAARDIRFNHPNMVVFSTTLKKYYYLKDGANGNNTSDWMALESSTLTFPQYDNNLPYLVGSPIAVGSTMFICVIDTIAGEDPANVPNKWMRINATVYLSVPFNSLDTVVINHNISSPVVQLVSADGDDLIGGIRRNSATQLTIYFNHVRSGTVILK